MAEWIKEYDLTDLDPDFAAIRSLFKSGYIKKMYQLEKQSPTKIASLLGLNYNSYHDKLRNPGAFTQTHINLLAYACKIDPNIIQDIIQNEIRENIEKLFSKYLKKNKR